MLPKGTPVSTPHRFPVSGDSGNTALHWASAFADAEMIKLLIKKGAQVNARNSDGATPLHDAVRRGDISVVNVCLH